MLASGIYPEDLITDGTYVYWTDENLRAIVKLDIATTTSQVLASSVDDARIGGAEMLTIDSTSIYLSVYGGCDADGGGCEGAVLKLTPR